MMCKCDSEGFACGDSALDGHDFCGNCHDGECKRAAENDVACRCHQDVPLDADDDFMTPEQLARLLIEPQLVALVRKHEQLDKIVGLLDDTPGSAERKAAACILDAMSELDTAIFEKLYEWVALQG